MPKYNYKVMKKDGTIEESTTEAPDRFAVYKQVQKEGQIVVSVTEVGANKNYSKMFNMESINAKIGRVKTAEKIIFTRNVSAMLEAGLTLSRALDVMERQTNNAKLREVLSTINGHVKKGNPFYEGLEKYPKVFPPIFVAMMRAGEESGSLATSLKMVGEQMDKSYMLKKKVKGAMLYPAIIIVAMIIITILMLMFVVPTLAQTFTDLNAELPTSTKAIIGASDFLAANSILSLTVIFIVVAFFVYAFRTKQGKRAYEWTILHLPIIGTLVKEVNSARTARTFSSLLSSGVDILGALSITNNVVQNSYFKEILSKAEKEIEKGEPISKVFIENIDLYPVLFGEIIAVGEETGKLSDMLEQIAVFYEREVDQKTKDMSTIIEPFLMVLIGLGVGFFAVSMISPIYSLSGAI